MSSTFMAPGPPPSEVDGDSDQTAMRRIDADTISQCIVRMLEAFESRPEGPSFESAAALIIYFVNVRQYQLESGNQNPTEYKFDTAIENSFVLSLWEEIFSVASRLHTDEQQEQLGLFVAEVGKYFFAVKTADPLAHQSTAPELVENCFIERRLYHYLRFDIDMEDPIEHIPWDQVQTDWKLSANGHDIWMLAKRTLTNTLSHPETSEGSRHHLNLHSFIAKLTRNHLFDFSPIGLNILKFILKPQPPNLAYFNRGFTSQRRREFAATYPAGPLIQTSQMTRRNREPK